MSRLTMEMERSKQRDNAALNDVITKAEQLAESGTALNLSEQSEEEASKVVTVARHDAIDAIAQVLENLCHRT